ncbi:Interspersed repeat-like protein [Schistosoma japonicum]|nr:Interspersed repeat-like protein [Schistosoma japonicum]KAH8851177.1 Interspersed repeat-like protein [Schistosoma japonicum]
MFYMNNNISNNQLRFNYFIINTHTQNYPLTTIPFVLHSIPERYQPVRHPRPYEYTPYPTYPPKYVRRPTKQREFSKYISSQRLHGYSKSHKPTTTRRQRYQPVRHSKRHQPARHSGSNLNYVNNLQGYTKEANPPVHQTLNKIYLQVFTNHKDHEEHDKPNLSRRKNYVKTLKVYPTAESVKINDANSVSF